MVIIELKNKQLMTNFNELGFSPEQEERLKQIGDCVKKIAEDQEADKYQILYDNTSATITIAGPIFRFDKFFNLSEWKLLNELVSSIEFDVDMTNKDDPLVVLSFSVLAIDDR